jgi:hypothetical protein
MNKEDIKIINFEYVNSRFIITYKLNGEVKDIETDPHAFIFSEEDARNYVFNELQKEG